MENFLAVGIVQNVHGIKGELKVAPLTDDINRFKDLKKVFILGEEKQVKSVKLQPKVAVVKIEGIDSREEAMKLKGEYLKVDRENVVKLPEGRFFVADIIGCEVIDENGVIYGKVDEVIFTGANDVYLVKRKGEDDLLIPVIDDVVFDIDVTDKKITIKPVEMWM